MKVCDRCGIQVRGEKRCCPLCQGRLRDPSDEELQSAMFLDEAFPQLPRHKVSRLTIAKLATFLCLAASIAFCAIGLLLDFQTPWPLWTMLGILVGWLDFLAVLYLRSNLLKLVSVEILAALATSLFTDFFTGQHGWGATWVWPFTVPVLTVVTFLLAKIRKMYFSEYVMYLVLDCVAAFLQAVPLYFKVQTVRVPAVLSMAAYLVLFIAILLFRFYELKTAASRRFHL